MIKLLIEREIVDINLADKDGYTALDHAALSGNLTVVSYLVERALQYVDTRNVLKRFTMPLYYSILYMHIDVGRFLVQNRAYTNAVLKKKNLLDVAVSSNKPELIGLLLENGCLIDQYNPCGITPLSQALLLAKYDSAEFLLEKGADYKKLSVKGNFSSLHYSIHGANAEEKGKELVRLLLEHIKKKEGEKRVTEYINYNDKNNSGTSLHEACRIRSYSGVKMSLQYGADRDIKNKEGNTPYDLLYATDNRNVCMQIRGLFHLDKEKQNSR